MVYKMPTSVAGVDPVCLKTPIQGDKCVNAPGPQDLTPPPEELAPRIGDERVPQSKYGRNVVQLHKRCQGGNSPLVQNWSPGPITVIGQELAGQTPPKTAVQKLNLPRIQV
jgi:hypothetical protein